jgi:HEAT repeat protein
MSRDKTETIIAELNGRTQMEAFEAAKVIERGSDVTLEPSLIATLQHGRRSLNRTAAAYALQRVRTIRTIKALERALADKSEYPRVRGQAAESLIHNHRTLSHDVLLKELGDASREVRFWCAFALGQMAERRAIPALEQLAATDKRVVRGFWSVAKEAADALKNIRNTNRYVHRKSGCAFCVGGSKEHPRAEARSQ